MIYYLIRHKATGEYMPQLERGRGYSHWNPAAVRTVDVFRPRKLIGVPRLLPSRRTAAHCIANWNAYPNSYTRSNRGDGWNDDPELAVGKDDGRKKEDLEIVEVAIVDRVDFQARYSELVEELQGV